MSRTIWRQELDLTTKQTITAPGLYRVVGIDNRRGPIEVWYEVDPDSRPRSLDIYIVGTGHPIPDEVTGGIEQWPLGHLISRSGNFVWHLYSVETPGQTR